VGPDERFWADVLQFHEVADHLIEARPSRRLSP
jgi:hypothetical protein